MEESKEKERQRSNRIVCIEADPMSAESRKELTLNLPKVINSKITKKEGKEYYLWLLLFCLQKDIGSALMTL